MSQFKLASLVSSFFLAVGCGGSPPAAPAHGGHGPHGGGEGHGHMGHDGHGHGGHGHEEGPGHKHGKMSPALHDFHEVLAPAWHATPGEERVKKSCDSSSALAEKAKATSDAELVAAVGEVAKACAETGRTRVESAMKTVHDRFHVLIKE